ncbi:MAG: nucleotide exchange factor GrpE, partial [Candidatus Altimarinota bacterium]
QQFQSFLEQQGVKKLEVKSGEMINPEHHEAVMSGEGADGQILEVFSPGYEMKGRIIKTAKVKVGRA